MTDRPTPAAVQDGLAPVRDALLADARADAEAVRERARGAVAEVIAAAESEAEEIRSRAHEEALEQAKDLQEAAESHARRRAREVELRAGREAYDGLVESARRKAQALLDDPAMRDSLAELVRRTANPDAEPGVEVSRTPDGFVATRPGRRTEFSLTALADAAVAQLLRDRGE